MDDQVKVLDPSGQPGSVPQEQVQQAIDQGYQIDTPQMQAERAQQEKYGTPGEQVKAGLEGIAKGIAGPAATGAEVGLGVKPEDIKGRAEANPVTHFGGELAGLVAPSMLGVGEAGQAGLLGEVGQGVAKGLELEGPAAVAARLGTENALYAIGDEISNRIINNPASIQTAAIRVGLSGLLGGVAGYGLGHVGELWKAKFGPAADKFVQDFASRTNDIANESVPTADAVHSELANEFSAVEGAKNDLRGDVGLKAQDVAKTLPQDLTPKMVQQANDIIHAADEMFAKAQAEPGIYQGARLQAMHDYASRLVTSLTDEQLSPAKLFTAIDDFKKGLGSLKKWSPLEGELQKPAASLVGELYHTVREGLEDPGIWGKAGQRQAAINKLWTEHIPAAEDFQRALTEKIGGEPVVSPNKVNTLVNGLGKANSEIKLEKLSNYLDANDKLYNQLEKIHKNLGVENPYKRPNLTNTRAILQDITPGMKAADFLHKQATNAAAEAMAGGAGALLGHLSGIPGGEYLGGMFGHYAIKPFMRVIAPSIIGPVLRGLPSGEGMKAALDAASAIMKGEHLLNSSVKSLFEAGTTTSLKELIPNSEQVDKLSKFLSMHAEAPESMLQTGGALSHYMPMHSMAMTATAQQALDYLKSQAPRDTQQGVLDRPVQPSSAQDAAFIRTLKISEQPLMVLALARQGTLTPKDVMDLKNLYPTVHAQIVQQVAKEMSSHLGNDGKVPFRMRGSLSLLLGQPVDSTFMPQSIAAAQSTYPVLAPPQPQGTPRAQKGTAKLGASSKLAQTPSEARQNALIERG